MAMTISKRNTVLSFLLTFIVLGSLQAQSFNGKVISSQGGEPVPFANVMIKGSTIGVATDMEGKFAITIPSEYSNEFIIISAVGYSNKEMPIEELNVKMVNIISISTQEYNIDEVDVEAESKVLYGAIKKCSKSIAENYITTPYSCDFIYTNNEKTAQGIITDVTGYQRTTFKGSFRKVRYQFSPNDSKATSTPYFEGQTNMEDLLSFDLVRTIGNVIDEQNVYDFKLNLDPQNRDPKLWVIHFTIDEPQLYNTGDAYAQSYEGELYIVKDNFAITKVVVRGTSEKRSAHGKGIMVSDESSNYSTNLSYEVTTNYSNEDGKYRLESIVMNEVFTDKAGQEQKVKSSFKVKAQKIDVVDIKGRDYYVKNL